MIISHQQLHVIYNRLRSLQATLQELEERGTQEGITPIIYEAQKNGLRTLIADLVDEIEQYEMLVQSKELQALIAVLAAMKKKENGIEEISLTIKIRGTSSEQYVLMCVEAGFSVEEVSGEEVSLVRTFNAH